MNLIQTGIYPTSFSDYLRIPAVSRSTIVAVIRSLAHMRHVMAQPPRETTAMREGSIIHTAVLEPEAFAGRYTVMPDLTDGMVTKDGKPTRSKNSAEYRQRVAAWEAEHTGMDCIAVELRDRALAIADAVRTHPDSAAMVDAEHCEITAVAKILGVHCKARPDAIGGGILWDLKTTADASPDAFGRTAINHHYWLQMAFYRDIIAALGCQIDEVRLVAVEAEAPHGIRVYRVTEDQMASGRAEYERLLSAYVTARATDRWPGYPEGLTDLPTPGWHYETDTVSAPMPDIEDTIGAYL